MKRPLRVLCVEDNLIDQQVMEAQLQTLSCMATVVSSGQGALEKLSSMPPGYYDLILMDIRMPGLSGLEAVAQIRNLRPPAKNTRVIAITAYAMRGDRETCLASGFDDYISKPCSKEQLKAAIQRQLPSFSLDKG